MSSHEQFSIGELSREFSITTRTIRFYEDRGLLAPSREGQTRVYDARDRVRLKLILRGKRLGFSLSEIAEMLDMYDAPQGERVQVQYFVQRIRERQAVLAEQREDIDSVLGELKALESRCEHILGVDPPCNETPVPVVPAPSVGTAQSKSSADKSATRSVNAVN
jgi:DNA-binding transcriptional MerR regulator